MEAKLIERLEKKAYQMARGICGGRIAIRKRNAIDRELLRQLDQTTDRVKIQDLVEAWKTNRYQIKIDDFEVNIEVKKMLHE